MHCRGVQYLAFFDKCQLGGSTANIDIQNSRATVVRRLCGTRTIGSQHRLHVMPGCCANKFPPLLGNHAGNCRRVLATQGLTGKDHDTSIDIIRMQLGRGIGLINNNAQRLFVNPRLALIRRQCHRRLVNRFTGFNDIAAGKILPPAAQRKSRKHDLRA